ncbi:restriction endonuclease subunit S [Xanthobacter sp. DSM 14520]|uniref:restriction endonuclease subunit S n=1 Tax=Xanthobacter autotrophicus (strain ATCC BAA-1158 / Py2) TaxID=78245 RepID=UPI00372C7C3F
MSLKTYPQMKSSGDTWLDQIPSHWQCLRLKTIATCNDEVLNESTPPEADLCYVEISDVAYGRGIIGDTQVQFATAPSRARRLVRDGDIIISTVRTYLKAIAIIKSRPDNLVVSTGFAVVRPLKVASSYLGYALLAEYLIAEIISRSTGVSYPGINASEIMTLRVAVPSIPEQHAIAAFLDRETTKIDALVAEQERLIELLAAKRRAIISHAVTKGLDPHAPMKDSGIEWLGEVPAHWEVRPIKHIASVKGRIGFRGYTTEDLVAEGEGPLALGGANIGLNGSLDLGRLTYISWDKYEESPEIKVFQGDVIVGQRGSCGEVALIAGDIGPATINPSLVIIRPAAISGSYLSYSMQSDATQSTFQSFLNATAVPMLSQMQIGSVPVCAPGGEEQGRIVTHLDRETTKLDTLG